MFLGKNHEQTILEISQGDYMNATADSFLIDRQAGSFPSTLSGSIGSSCAPSLNIATQTR